MFRVSRVSASMFLGLLLALVPAAGAWAHGPTVKVRYGRLAPEVITIEVGQTVHFQNINTSALPCTVVADGGVFESPTMQKGGGWHHTFEAAGDFAYGLKESARTRGRVVVVEKPGS